MATENATKAQYITSVTGGVVLTQKADGRPTGVVVQNADNSAAQQWTVEYGDKPDIIALRSVGNKLYLHAFGNVSGAAVGPGEKQWWKISRDGLLDAPSAFRLSPVDYPDVYLNHFRGVLTQNTKVWMWRWEQPNRMWLSWYFMDCNSDWKPSATGSAEDSKASEDAKAKLKDLEQREAALIKKEQNQAAEGDAKSKDLEQCEAALAKKEKDLAAQEAEQSKLRDQLKEKEDELAKKGEAEAVDDGGADWQKEELQRKLDEVQAAERDLASKQAAMDKQKEQNDTKAKDLKRKDDERKAAEQDLNAKQAAMDKQKEQNDAKTAELKRKDDERKVAEQDLNAKKAAMDKQQQQNEAKEDELNRREAELARKPNSNDTSPTDLLKAKNENLKLQLKIKELEKQLADAKKPSPAAAAANGVPSADDRVVELEAENARLKGLIAQQVRQHIDSSKSEAKPVSKPEAKHAPSTEHNGAKQSTPASRNPPVATTPSANTSKRLTKPACSGAPSSTGNAPSSADSQPKGPKKDAGAGNSKPANGRPPPADDETERLRRENARLRAELSREDSKPATTTTKRPSAQSSPTQKGGDTKQNNIANPYHTTEHHHGDPEVALRFRCGHVAYPGPRKIERKMVGILYEQ